VIWECFKRWPQLLPFETAADLTEEESAWVAMQGKIDEGLQWCARCQHWGFRDFCGHCGIRFDGLTWRSCPNPKCRARVATDWCVLCGARVSSDALRAWERGEYDFTTSAANAERWLQKIYARRPDFAPDAPPPAPTSLGAAVVAALAKST